jgi:predicted hydrolase (HD superfamily)
MNFEQAHNILHEYTHTKSLLKHAYAVEAAMRAYANKFGEDENRWGAIGLLHDFDYEQFPEEHPYKGETVLKEKGISEEIRQIIMSHAAYTGVARDSLVAKTLFAVDELCGFITAVTLVRPNKSLGEVKVKSVKKKLKDKAFAAKVNREEIYQGAEELGVDFDTHIAFVIDALRPVAEKLELNP